MRDEWKLFCEARIFVASSRFFMCPFILSHPATKAQGVLAQRDDEQHVTLRAKPEPHVPSTKGAWQIF
jgi:hypothetical protein